MEFSSVSATCLTPRQPQPKQQGPGGGRGGPLDPGHGGPLSPTRLWCGGQEEKLWSPEPVLGHLGLRSYADGWVTTVRQLDEDPLLLTMTKTSWGQRVSGAPDDHRVGVQAQWTVGFASPGSPYWKRER